MVIVQQLFLSSRAVRGLRVRARGRAYPYGELSQACDIRIYALRRLRNAPRVCQAATASAERIIHRQNRNSSRLSRGAASRVRARIFKITESHDVLAKREFNGA